MTDDPFADWLDRHRVEPLGPEPGAYERIARSARRRRTVRVTAVAAAVTAVLGGVTGVAYQISAGPAPVLPPGASPSQTSSQSSSPSQSSSQSPPPLPSQQPTLSAAASPPVQPARCHTGDLRVTAQPAPGGGAAGSVYTWLVFRNVSAGSCTLLGFPGVSWVTGAGGEQVNDPARRVAGVSPVRVVLVSQGVGRAVVRHGQPGAFEPACQAVPVGGFRVYVPDESVPVFVPWAAQACSAKGVNVATVSPIVAGLTERQG